MCIRDSCEEEAGHLHFQETCLTAEQMAHLQRTIRQLIVRLFVQRGEGRFQGNRHGFQDRSDEPGGKLEGNHG